MNHDELRSALLAIQPPAFKRLQDRISCDLVLMHEPHPNIFVIAHCPSWTNDIGFARWDDLDGWCSIHINLDNWVSIDRTVESVVEWADKYNRLIAEEVLPV